MNTFFRRTWWSTADKVVGVFVVLFMIQHLFGPTFGRWEGNRFPVVKDFRFEVENLDDDGMVVVKGDFDLIRDKCEFKGVNWKISNGSRKVDVPIEFRNGAKIRHKGLNKFSNWALDIPPQLLGESVVVVRHQCPYTPWVTTTQLYPVEEK